MEGPLIADFGLVQWVKNFGCCMWQRTCENVFGHNQFFQMLHLMHVHGQLSFRLIVAHTMPHSWTYLKQRMVRTQINHCFATASVQGWEGFQASSLS
jgi:hypothetical protein